MTDVAKRVHVTLPPPVYAELEQWAKQREQPIATVAAIAIERALMAVKDSGELPQPESPTPNQGK